MKRWLFSQIHRHNLIYNQCWEDPILDKQALGIVPDDRIVMITSAGCNALDYLIDDPRHIDCVDLNPHQTALLDLKMAGIRALSHGDFFQMFGRGCITGHRELYSRTLRPLLMAESRRVWDRRIDYFDPQGRGLYFHGTSGLFARFLNWHVDRRVGLRFYLTRMEMASTLAEQADLYRDRVAPLLWSPAIRWLLRRQFTMSLLGVPAEQVRQMRETDSPEVDGCIQRRVDRVFTEVPLARNYFWRVYINGAYSEDCCPNYLRPEYFELLRARVERIHLHTMSLTEFLKSSGNMFSVFVLLDHMDWLTGSERALEEEWTAILRAARAGARIIYRSGGLSFDRIPEFAMRQIEFRPDVTGALHGSDRVGTYGSFYLASVRA